MAAFELVEGDLLAQAVEKLLATQIGWEGSAMKLFDDLGVYKPDNGKLWPGSSSSMTRMLNNLAPSLAKVGISYTKKKERNGAKIMLIRQRKKNC